MQVIFRTLVLVLIVVAAVVLMRPVQAQSESSIFKVGQRLTLTYVGDRVVECNVGEIRGVFIQCVDNKIMWFNTSTTIALTVREGRP